MRQALEQALAAMQFALPMAEEEWNYEPIACQGVQAINLLRDAIRAAEQALAQPAPEPVAWTTMPDAGTWTFISGPADPNCRLPGKWIPLYASAPQRRPLTDAAIERLWAAAEPLPKRPGQAGHAAIARNFARRVEREHGIE